LSIPGSSSAKKENGKCYSQIQAQLPFRNAASPTQNSHSDESQLNRLILTLIKCAYLLLCC
jgi:hypothetical protein